MSLVGTLAKVALGVAAVKGAGYVARVKGWRQGKFRQQQQPSRTGRGTGKRRWCPTRNWRPANLSPRRQGPGGRRNLVACSNSSLPLQVPGPLPARRHRLQAAVSTR